MDLAPMASVASSTGALILAADMFLNQADGFFAGIYELIIVLMITKLVLQACRRLRDDQHLEHLVWVVEFMPLILMIVSFIPDTLLPSRILSVDEYCQLAHSVFNNHWGSRQACYMRGNPAQFCEHSFLAKMETSFKESTDYYRTVCWPRWKHVNEVPMEILR